MEDATHQRFSELLTSLKEKKYIESQADLAKKYVCEESFISNIKKNKADIPLDLIKFLMDNYSVSADWILKGKGTMFLNEQTNILNEEKVQYGKSLEDKEKIIELQSKLLKQYERLEANAKAG